jgi:hypothetical protein
MALSEICAGSDRFGRYKIVGTYTNGMPIGELFMTKNSHEGMTPADFRELEDERREAARRALQQTQKKSLLTMIKIPEIMTPAKLQRSFHALTSLI